MTETRSASDGVSILTNLTGLMVAYFAAAVVGLQWAQVQGAGSPVWPAFGISVAALLLGGIRLWPAIFFARLAAGIYVGSDQPLWAEVAIASANAISDVAAVMVIRRLGGVDTRLSTLKDVLVLAFAICASSCIAATLGSLTLTTSSNLPFDTAKLIWLGWWLGNVVAGLTVTPMILTLSNSEKRHMSSGDALHFMACLATNVMLIALMVGRHQGGYLRPWHLYPALIWAAIPFGPAGASVILTAVSGLMIWGASTSSLTFFPADTGIANQVLFAQQFIAIAALTVLLLSAVADERRAKSVLQRRERALADANARLEAVFEAAALGAWHWRFQENHLETSERWIEALGYSKAEMPTEIPEWDKLVHPDDLPAMQAALHAYLAGETRTYSIEHRLRHKDGHWLWVLTSGRVVERDEDGEPLIITGTHLDISSRKEAEEQLRESQERAAHLAYYDSLTGLPNRVLMLDRLNQMLHAMERTPSQLAVHCIDLDQFKAVNDTLGHQAGDELLKKIADRLNMLSRSSDTVSRLGGDEFVLIQGNADASKAAQLAERIIDAVSKPVNLSKGQVFVGCSVGISVAMSPGLETTEMLRQADLALYKAKAAGRGQFAFFEVELDAALKMRKSLEADLRTAMDEGALHMAYQPQVNRHGQLTGVEALIRWNHPTKGPIAPATFIPVAEEYGLINDLGAFALRQTLEDAQNWGDITVAVNISPLQLRSPDFSRTVEKLLHRFDRKPGALEIEVTETMLISDDIRATKSLSRLKKLGCSIALDDFGIGHSSLTSLQKFPVDRLKIDRSFVSKIAKDAQSKAIVEAIIRLAKALDMEVIAEGVETADQLNILSELGCSTFQGFHFGKPMEAGMVTAMIQSLSSLEGQS